MKSIKFKRDCNYKGQSFFANKVPNEINPLEIEDWTSIWKLNEKGFIEPLTVKEFLEIQNEVNKLKNKKKKESEE